jgi:hypothetical protein
MQELNKFLEKEFYDETRRLPQAHGDYWNGSTPVGPADGMTLELAGTPDSVSGNRSSWTHPDASGTNPFTIMRLANAFVRPADGVSD